MSVRRTGEVGPAARNGAESAEPRIILVGRTGLETRLRSLGPSRVRRALDAIGELAEPMGHASEPGAPAPVVVVGADADPGEGAGGEGGAAEFVRALRRVEPRVHVLRVAGAGHGAGAYDGVVAADGPMDAVIGAMGGAATGADGASGPDAPPAAAREAATPDEARCDEGGGGEVGDAELIGLLLKGQDVAPAAVRLVRERTGDPGVRFAPDGVEGAPEGGGAEVVWQGHRFGRLVGGGAATGTAGALAGQARWLAGWLALAAQQAQLREQAFTDCLTGAWNRRYYGRFMEAALEGAQRDRRYLTVLVFDIDDFKRYNDEFGHAAGDAILVETVRLLRSVIRPSDKVCRIGGDEFAVIFHEPDGPRTPASKPPESISEIAQRFQRQICEHKFPKLGEQAPGTLTVSGGLATFPWDGRTGDELLARADELALRGKRAGKNTIVIGPGAAEVGGAGAG